MGRLMGRMSNPNPYARLGVPFYVSVGETLRLAMGLWAGGTLQPVTVGKRTRNKEKIAPVLEVPIGKAITSPLPPFNR